MPTDIKLPTIELKNVKTFRGREGHGLNADLVVNGIKICFVRDAGNGGCMDFDIIGDTDEERKVNRAILNMVETYATNLPEKTYPASLGGGNYKQDLESLVNELFDDAEVKKEQKKIAKKMVNTIMWGVPNGSTYTQSKFKLPFTVAHRFQLQKYIDEKVKPSLKEGEVILNTNLQALGITI